MGISVRPILASVERPNPLKMSLMPQTAKLAASTPMTTPMMVRPSQFAEALRIPRSIKVQRVGCADGCPARAAHHRGGRAHPQPTGFLLERLFSVCKASANASLSQLFRRHVEHKVRDINDGAPSARRWQL